MKAQEIGKRAVKLTNSIVNIIVLTIILLLLTFAGYALWDSEQIYQAADKSHYAVYKPTVENEGKTFKELQTLNGEVIAWLTIYGTNIDYPVTQGTDNMKYVNTNAEGLYSLSGAIFLDYKNSRDFQDFNSILYGHHMQKKAMFGEIGQFSDRNMFDTHTYGNLYFDGNDHGIEFFAFVHTDAYDGEIFSANVIGEDNQRTYLDNLLAKAKYTRDIGITIMDRIILLSTCSNVSTNGRDILIGRITDKLYEDTFAITTEMNDEKEQLSVDNRGSFLEEYRNLLVVIALLLLMAILLIILILVIKHKSKHSKRGRKL